MVKSTDIDGILITWGDRLFYPGNRMVKGSSLPRPGGESKRQLVASIRRRIQATVVRRVPQVMVKVTGGGRGMRAIAAHWRYISKNGRLGIEDQCGETMRGKASLCELADEWRLGGSRIPEDSELGRRREALNIMLSMPREGASAAAVQQAARAFARTELAGHKYVMVLHDHQANPHVHISVRTESREGRRLSPRKADLHRWRETFAEKLREQGIEAEATRQVTRGAAHRHPDLWQVKAASEGRLLKARAPHRQGMVAAARRQQARTAWREIANALAASGDENDRVLAESIGRFIGNAQHESEPVRKTLARQPETERGTQR